MMLLYPEAMHICKSKPQELKQHEYSLSLSLILVQFSIVIPGCQVEREKKTFSCRSDIKWTCALELLPCPLIHVSCLLIDVR